MRYIDTSAFAPDPAWQEKADTLTAELIEATGEERKKIIEKNQDVWKELRDPLLEVSFWKCWYSEAEEIFSELDVDHYRPKSRAKNLDGSFRDGYWWLTFNWHNYRMAGIVGNRHLKKDMFPLRENSLIADEPELSLAEEQPYFLDPTNPDDVALISFDEAGNAIPAVAPDTWEYQRVQETIHYYKLDFPALVRKRKQLWQKASVFIARAAQLDEALRVRQNAEKRAELKFIIMELKAMTEPQSELSATVKACLRKSGLNWAKKLADKF